MKKIFTGLAASLLCFSYAHANDTYCTTFEHEGSHYAYVISVNTQRAMCTFHACSFPFVMNGGNISAPPDANVGRDKNAAWWNNACSSFAQSGPEQNELKGNLTIKNSTGFFNTPNSVAMTFNVKHGSSPFSFEDSSYFVDSSGKGIRARFGSKSCHEVAFYKFSSMK